MGVTIPSHELDIIGVKKDYIRFLVCGINFLAFQGISSVNRDALKHYHINILQTRIPVVTYLQAAALAVFQKPNV